MPRSIELPSGRPHGPTSPGHRGDLLRDVPFLQRPFTTEGLIATLVDVLRGE